MKTAAKYEDLQETETKRETQDTRITQDSSSSSSNNNKKPGTAAEAAAAAEEAETDASGSNDYSRKREKPLAFWLCLCFYSLGEQMT